MNNTRFVSQFNQLSRLLAVHRKGFFTYYMFTCPEYINVNFIMKVIGRAIVNHIYIFVRYKLVIIAIWPVNVKLLRLCICHCLIPLLSYGKIVRCMQHDQ